MTTQELPDTPAFSLQSALCFTYEILLGAVEMADDILTRWMEDDDEQ